VKRFSLATFFLFVFSFLVLEVTLLLNASPHITAEAIDNYLSGEGSPLAGLGQVLVEKGRQYNVDPRLVVAIACHETTFGTRLCAPYNAWNWFHGGECPKSPFDSWEQGIDIVTEALGRFYFEEMGRRTIPDIGAKYCAVGCEHWIPEVTWFYYDELKGNLADLTFEYIFSPGDQIIVIADTDLKFTPGGNATRNIQKNTTGTILTHHNNGQEVNGCFWWYVSFEGQEMCYVGWIESSALEPDTGQVAMPQNLDDIPASFFFSQYLAFGAKNQEVAYLQIVLREFVGDLVGPIDGDFGSKTKAAVIEYQQLRNLGVDGIVGPETRGSLNQDLAKLRLPPDPGPEPEPIIIDPEPEPIPDPDTTPPSVSLGLGGSNKNGWWSSVEALLHVTDNDSGIKFVKYKINSGSWIIYDTRFSVLSEGTVIISCYVEDNAGNSKEIAFDAIKVDNTSPSKPRVNVAYDAKLYANWSSSDSLSGIAGYQYAIGTSAGASDLVSWAQTENTQIIKSNLNLEPGKAHYVSVRAQDMAGHWSEIGCTAFIVPDSTLPVSLTSFTATFVNSAVTLRWITESEINNLGFNIYRDAQKIAFVKGAGTTSAKHSYVFIDKNIKPNKTYFYHVEDIDFSGKTNKSDIIKIAMPEKPKALVKSVPPVVFGLFQNYPNPFNPETWIPFRMSQNQKANLYIFNSRGQLVRKFENCASPVHWNGRNSSGDKAASGIYFYTLQAKSYFATRKMVLAK